MNGEALLFRMLRLIVVQVIIQVMVLSLMKSLRMILVVCSVSSSCLLALLTP